MSDGKKTLATFLGLFLWGSVWLLFEKSVGLGATPQLIAIVPLACLMGSALLFRWPAYIERYMQAEVERDAERGLVSIYNLGLASIVVLPIIMLFLFT